MDAIDHFDSRADDWDALYQRPQFADRLKLFVNAIEQKVDSGARILDYGCGSGQIARTLAERGYRVLGIDGSSKMIESAKARATVTDPDRLSFAAIDHQTWQPEGTVDAVVCSSVIEYVEADDELLGKLSAALAPKGTLVISVPAKESLLGRLEDALHRGEKDIAFAHRRYTRAEFEGKLANAGLTALQATSFEVPRLGKPGVMLSRIPVIGVMRIFIAKKK